MTGPAADTGTTPAPAADVPAQAATTALPTDNAIDPGMFVPPATRDNYLAIIRDQAAIRGDSPDAVRDELVDQFRTLHERQPLDGYDHLAAWLADADVTAGVGPTGMQVLTARAVESARRDPYQAVIGDQALVEVAVASQTSADEAAAAAAVSPSVDPSSGMLPNPGPLPVPADVTTVDPAVAEQQQAAQAQLAGDMAPEDAPPTADAASPPPASPAPSDSPTTTASAPAAAPAQDAPADTATPPAADTTSSTTTTSGKGSKSSGGPSGS